MGLICTCLVVWGITQRGGDDDNGGNEEDKESPSLHQTRNDGIPYFAIEPEEIQRGEIVTARWALRHPSTEELYLDIAHQQYSPLHKWPIDDSSAGIFTFTLPTTLNRSSPILFQLVQGMDRASVSVPMVCKREWFFEPRIPQCPGEIRRIRAWQQDFEYGTRIHFEEDVSSAYTGGYSLGEDGYIGSTYLQLEKENFGNPVGVERVFWTCYTVAGRGNSSGIYGFNVYFNDADSRIISMHHTRWRWRRWSFVEGNFIDCDQGEQG